MRREQALAFRFRVQGSEFRVEQGESAQNCTCALTTGFWFTESAQSVCEKWTRSQNGAFCLALRCVEKAVSTADTAFSPRLDPVKNRSFCASRHFSHTLSLNHIARRFACSTPTQFPFNLALRARFNALLILADVPPSVIPPIFAHGAFY
jgi:hypothetical protein